MGPFATRSPFCDSGSAAMAVYHTHTNLVMKAAVAPLVGALTLSSTAYGFVVCPKFAHRSSSRSDHRSPPATTSTTATPVVHVSQQQQQQQRALKSEHQERERPAELKFISILSVGLQYHREHPYHRFYVHLAVAVACFGPSRAATNILVCTVDGCVLEVTQALAD